MKMYFYTSEFAAKLPAVNLQRTFFLEANTVLQQQRPHKAMQEQPPELE